MKTAACQSLRRTLAADRPAFGLFAPVGDYRLALLAAGFLFIPAALVALLLPEPPDEVGSS